MFEDSYGNKILYRRLLAAAALCFFIAGVWWLVDRIDESSVQRRMVNNTNLVESMMGRVGLARSEFVKNSPSFADHWSTGFDERLTAAEKYFGPEGNAFQDLALAKDALATNDRTTAKKYLDQIEIKLGEATGVVDQILGPPDRPEQALYLGLLQKALQADSEISLAQSCVLTSEVQVALQISSPNYYAGVGQLDNAKLFLSQAISANTYPVERGILDKPLAYDLAVSSYNSCLVAPQVAAPPPPTSEPPSIIIIDNSGSGDDDSGGWDSGSDDGGWDSGGWDSGSDDGGWDSGGWDSGSDDGGWDSGGDW